MASSSISTRRIRCLECAFDGTAVAGSGFVLYKKTFRLYILHRMRVFEFKIKHCSQNSLRHIFSCKKKKKYLGPPSGNFPGSGLMTVITHINLKSQISQDWIGRLVSADQSNLEKSEI